MPILDIQFGVREALCRPQLEDVVVKGDDVVAPRCTLYGEELRVTDGARLRVDGAIVAERAIVDGQLYVHGVVELALWA